MRKRELLVRGISAGTTLLFLAAVRPDPTPAPIEWAIVALLLYEGLRISIDYIQKVNKKRKEERYITVTKIDMRRWADEWIDHPMFERVREVHL